ncbi:magnesium-translocating P-type ATPase [Myroides odoratus]|uniref:magnesium-translocating P-type ATPase n=1 Tax=Myroides odoratus TaxID=256 RepID=UPI0039AEB91A
MKKKVRYIKKEQQNEFLIAIASKKSEEECLIEWNTQVDGLLESDATIRLQTYGLNSVALEKVPSLLIQLVQAFKNPFILVLFVLAIISFFTDCWLPKSQGEETELAGVIIIVTMMLLSGLLRFWQELRTNKAALALRSLVRTTVNVQRRHTQTGETSRREVNLETLVPGDIIHLSAGDLVPADIRIFYSKDLFVSQAALSGESLPVEKYDILSAISSKNSGAQRKEDVSDDLLSFDNICLMGTNISSGYASGIVIATGSKTYFGNLAKSIIGTRSLTSFDRGVNSVSWLLIRFMAIMVPIVFLINGLTKGDWLQALLFALAIAVGLTPEMLPMIVNANLAKGAIAMAKQKVVVKRLNAIQNLGAMDVLCTDKTGTLTQDKITLSNYYDINLENNPNVLYWAWLNSFHQSGVKNLMDRAIIRYFDSNQEKELAPFECQKRIDEIPFDFERRRLSVIVSNEKGVHTLICKGAVEEMLEVASYIDTGFEILPLTNEWQEKLIQIAANFNKDGYRVLLLGTRVLVHDDKKNHYTVVDEKKIIIQGFLTFIDPPKDSTAEALHALKNKGISVKVLTGDNPVITKKICKDVGLSTSSILLGAAIEAMSDSELRIQVEDVSIFAKLSPMQKNRILKALQANGHTVGFLGDGINDAPALRDADVGISVDSGTDIAKESADMILLEKDLMVLEKGVIKGRETFGNIIKYLNMTASSNFGNVFSVLIASAFIPFLPMLAIHLLLQNLLYDISQLSLPWDKMDEEFLRKPRKWDAKNIGRFMLWIGPTSSLFDITTFAIMWFIIGANSIELQALFQSGWFVEGLLSQTLVVHMLRTQKIPFIQSTATLPVLLLTATIMVFGLYIPFSSLGTYVGLVPLPWSYFPWLVVTLLSYCIVTQGMKRFYIKRFGQWF